MKSKDEKILATKFKKTQVLKEKISFFYVICDLRKQKTMKGYILLNPIFKKQIYEDGYPIFCNQGFDNKGCRYFKYTILEPRNSKE